MKLTDLALDYRELIAKERESPVILPAEIPIHPQVYESDFAYIQDFIERVKLKVPESIRKDLDAIASFLPSAPAISVGNLEMSEPDSGKVFSYDSIDFSYSPEQKYVKLKLNDTSMALSREDRRIFFPCEFHPMNEEKLAQYSFETLEDGHLIRAWHTSNIWGNGLLGELYFRNFAIVFNNLGLEVLEEKNSEK